MNSGHATSLSLAWAILPDFPNVRIRISILQWRRVIGEYVTQTGEEREPFFYVLQSLYKVSFRTGTVI